MGNNFLDIQYDTRVQLYLDFIKSNAFCKYAQDVLNQFCVVTSHINWDQTSWRRVLKRISRIKRS